MVLIAFALYFIINICIYHQHSCRILFWVCTHFYQWLPCIQMLWCYSLGCLLWILRAPSSIFLKTSLVMSFLRFWHSPYLFLFAENLAGFDSLGHQLFSFSSLNKQPHLTSKDFARPSAGSHSEISSTTILCAHDDFLSPNLDKFNIIWPELILCELYILETFNSFCFGIRNQRQGLPITRQALMPVSYLPILMETSDFSKSVYLSLSSGLEHPLLQFL